MPDIVVIGSLNMDLVVRVPHAPQAGETVLGSHLRMVPGGKGANQAAAAARLGASVEMVGRVGGDAFGQALIDNLAEQGVGTKHIMVDQSASTGVALILVEPSGQNRIVLSAGANARVNKGDVDAADGALRQAKILLLQLEIPLEVVDYAVARAANYALMAILNPAPANEISPSLIGRAQWVVPNEVEAGTLCGLAVDDVRTAQQAAAKFLDWGVPRVIITLGEKGCLLADGTGMWYLPAPAVAAMDTTAAGDAFIGALALGLLKGMPAADAASFANCAGALATTRMGAQTSLPYAGEVEALYAQHRQQARWRQPCGLSSGGRSHATEG